MKKYLVFLLVLLFAIGAASASSSLDDALNDLESLTNLNVEYFESDTNVTVGGYNFTIPQGFGPIDQLSVDVSKNNDSENIEFFTNSNNDVIMVSITGSDDINGTIYDYLPDGITGENATIKGFEGVKWSEKSYAFFTFQENNDIVVLQAPQDSYFEKMIV
ncbi:MAG: hypothetical protein Q4Q14_07670 [Methanobrevibacter sp.]|nr:hypothetical protein [Methanobrevibacter sp.]